MNLRDKDRLREAFLLAVYDALGSSVGRDGTLAEIAINQAKLLEVQDSEKSVLEETVLYFSRRNLVRNLTAQYGGGLSPAGVDEAERILRSRATPEASSPSLRPSSEAHCPRKGERHIGQWTYLANRCIGKGGNGVVYAAYRTSDEQRKTDHVVKILENVADPERVARMKREIEVLSRLDHPGILRVVDFDLNAEKPYLVAPYYKRQSVTLEHLQAMTPSERLRWFAKLCRAFGHAHAQKITHRDIKPDNILLTDEGEPLVADFGICHLADGERNTATSAVMASRFCTAPEVETGRAKEIGPECDVYCLGKLLYWMFSNGRNLPREDLRDADYDLTLQEPRAIHAHVYQLLERMVIRTASSRLRDAAAVATIAEELAERIDMDGHVLDLNVPQRCTFCLAGNYEVVVDPQWWSGSFKPGQGVGDAFAHAQNACKSYGLLANHGAPWLVLRCNRCGHVQIFQLHGGVSNQWTFKN
jgi:serine/threonine protein kinase